MSENGDLREVPAPTVASISPETNATNAESNAVAAAQGLAQNEVNTVQTEALNGAMDTQLSQNVAIVAPTMGLVVVVPEFQVVHDSWEAFEEALKAYGKMTYQLYVIRSTTSVKRRNIKISESSARGDSGSLRKELGMEHDVDMGDHLVERTLIPEQYQWYSKSLKCTHGWKDRHRGTGKRGSGVVRSTSCPAKMCVTLQHRGPSPDDWKVVVTKHVRTHNHQLSRELYLYYTENRRIYDPELLSVIGDVSGADGASKASVDLVNQHVASLVDQTNQRPGLYRVLASNDDQTQQQASMPFITSDSVDKQQLVAVSDASGVNFAIRPRPNSTVPLTAMPPLGAMILTPGTIPSRALDGGGFCVPRVSMKVHGSWDAFHDYIAQYAFDTAQVFRTRSTVSVSARNTKILASIAAKTGGENHDVASYASYAAASPTSRLIPEEFKWFSKLLICTYGWKRRARSKTPRLGEEGPCPAMLLARMERNVDGNWHVVINRQVPEHNHKLGGHVEDDIGVVHESVESQSDANGVLTAPTSLEPAPAQNSSVDSSLLEPQALTAATDVEASSLSQREIVVRVPKLQSVFKSWDDFHTSLKAYSDATYQLYRTRTTSSAKGRNKKIAQMKRSEDDDNFAGTDPEAALNSVNMARKIPEAWRWYSKTLTCTHGWKERHRGTGKRSAHGIRSTACPVKICATVQYVNPSSGLEAGLVSIEDSDESCWRVVVTKHIVDHNHNLSRELYQHYCENRRIYDPELLAIDTSNSGIVVTRKAYQASSEPNTPTPPEGNQLQVTSQSHVLPTQMEAGLAEAMNHAQLYVASIGNPIQQPVAVPTPVQQSVPSVVLLPYSTAASYLPSHAQAQQPEPQLQTQQEEQQVLAAFTNSSATAQLGQTSEGEAVATLSAVAAPGLASANIMLLNNAMAGAFPPSGANAIPVCRVHRPSIGTDKEPGDSSAHCTCFRLPSGGNYVTIVPSSEPITSSDTGFEVDDDALVYADEVEGVWHPSSTIETEKVTTESGESIWRAPRIIRRYPTWEAFHKYLDAYSAATFQLYRVRTTYSVRSRNIRLRQLAASRGLSVREGAPETETEEGVHGISRAHLVPEQFEWYSKTFLCTHGWKRRSRGSGQRVSHNVRATDCPAKVCATLQRTDGSSTWSVVVTKHLTEHNHELSETLYQQYCEVRRVRDPAVLTQAEQLWRGGATRRRVFELLKERSPNQIILMKDVHNLVQRWQTQERRSRPSQQEEGGQEEEHSGENATAENGTWL